MDETLSDHEMDSKWMDGLFLQWKNSSTTVGLDHRVI